jgi:hypothetical protein
VFFGNPSGIPEEIRKSSRRTSEEPANEIWTDIEGIWQNFNRIKAA